MRQERWTEVDGVPVVWVEAPGPLRASLQFRCGIAHETAPTHGITHLVEHLTLYGMHERPYAVNGSVDLTRSMFVARGTPEEIAEYLATVCQALRALPAQRVALERQVLKAEADSRASGYRDALLHWRYGSQAHGLAGTYELGLHWLDAPTVQAWAAEKLTRPNAVLALSGPPPAGLRLPLADGPVTPVVPATVVESVIPGYAATNTAGIALGATPRAGVAPQVALGILHADVMRVARHERALTYSVDAGYEVLDATHGHVVLSADSDSTQHEALRDAFYGVFERRVASGADEQSYTRAVGERVRVDDDDIVLAMLDATARDALLGRPQRSFDQRRDEAVDVPIEEVDAALREMAASALFLVPVGVTLPRTRALPSWSAATVTGERFRSVCNDNTLVLGPDGVGVETPDGNVTVRWTDTVAVLWWHDGSRIVQGRDGFRVTLLPDEWKDGTRAVQGLDTRVPPGIAVPMGAKGPPPAPPRPKEPPAWAPWVWIGAGFVLAIVLIAAGVGQESPGDPGSTAFFGLLFLFASLFGVAGQLTRIQERHHRRKRD